LINVKGDLENHKKAGSRIKTLPIAYSNVNLVDPESGEATRIRIAVTDEGKRVRIAKKSGSIIEYPEHQSKSDRIKDITDGILDTSPEMVDEITYKGEDFAQIKRKFSRFIRVKEAREKLLVFNE